MTASDSNTDKKLIGIICERSVDLEEIVDENGYLKSDPTVRCITVPCSGMIQPIMLETALKEGACGTFATGCRMGDCHYREGNKFLRERLLGTRMPKLKPTVDKSKIQAFWLSAVEVEKFVELIEEFKAQLKAQEEEALASASS